MKSSISSKYNVVFILGSYKWLKDIKQLNGSSYSMSKCPTDYVLVMLKIIIKFFNIVKLKSTEKNVSSKQSLAKDFVNKPYFVNTIIQLFLSRLSV